MEAWQVIKLLLAVADFVVVQLMHALVSCAHCLADTIVFPSACFRSCYSNGTCHLCLCQMLHSCNTHHAILLRVLCLVHPVDT